MARQQGLQPIGAEGVTVQSDALLRHAPRGTAAAQRQSVGGHIPDARAAPTQRGAASSKDMKRHSRQAGQSRAVMYRQAGRV